MAVVSFTSKLGNKAQELRGRFKRNTGEVTGNRRLQAKGRSDEVKGRFRRMVEKVKDMFRGRGRRRHHP
ncbi:CsbD family protein [Pseudonocardia xinjiangensis]|uniref:CsbD family protein n=1 Tax=Pseudonocardia xinjiangensis TaxID=75289 RepID=A0ABX1RB57_9PSEU|nr:CsbD family protein [Pseudonocardia xinjiangensis]